MSDNHDSRKLLDAFGGVVKKVRHEVASQINELKASSASKREIGLLEDKLDKRIGEIDAIVSDLSEKAYPNNEQVVATLANVRDTLKKELASAQANKIKTTETLQDFGARIDETFNALDVFQKAWSDVEGTAKAAQEEASSAVERVDAVEEKLDHNSESVKQLEGLLDEMRSNLKQTVEDMQADESLSVELKGNVSEVREKLSDDIDELAKIVKSVETDRIDQRKALDEYKADIAGQMDTLARRVLKAHSAIEPWLRGDPGYKQTALVKHVGGVWQALEETTDEPGASEHWTLVLDGVKAIEIEPSDKEDGSYRHKYVRASGQVDAYDVPFPTMAQKGSWQEGVTYKFFDLVIHEFNAYLNIKAENNTKPGPGADGWIQIGFRGQRGRTGKRWTEDETRDLLIPIAEALTMEEVAKQLFPAISEALNAGAGIPILSFRGVWESQTYPRGHVVSSGLHMHIATRDTQPDEGPMSLGGSSPWLLMVSGGGGGGGGGGAGGGYTTGQANGSTVATTDNTINLTGTGDATVSAATAGGVTTWTINATPGGASGGIVSGTPFVVGELMQISSDVGSGEAVSSGLTAAAINAHIADGSIHYAQTAIDHGVIFGLNDDDHPQYLNEARGDARYDLLGTGQAAADVVQGNLDSHVGTGGTAEHPTFTSGTEGFATAPGAGTNSRYMAPDGSWKETGAYPGLGYLWSTSTNTTTDPGTGYVQGNAASWAGMTELAIDDLSRLGFDMRTWHLGLRVGTEIRIAEEVDATTQGVFEVAGEPIPEISFVRVPVTFVSASGGQPANDAPVRVLQALAGAAQFRTSITQQHTWAISGAYGAGETVAQMRVRLVTKETCDLTAVSVRNESGTGQITVRKNGVALAGYSSLPVGTAWADTTGSELLVTGDYLDFVIDASTSGEGLNVTMHKVHQQ